MIVGKGGHQYERIERWGEVPPGFQFTPYLWTPLDMATDSQDRVFVFGKGNHPLAVFDRQGKFITCWGEGEFATPHGLHIGPDDTLYLVDCQGNRVEKRTRLGELLLTLDSEREYWAGPGHLLGQAL